MCVCMCWENWWASENGRVQAAVGVDYITHLPPLVTLGSEQLARMVVKEREEGNMENNRKQIENY